MKKKSKKKIAEARIQYASYGFCIPMMVIPKLYSMLEAAEANGASDADLKALVAGFPGVEAA